MTPNRARVALGLIRLTNGIVALLLPSVLQRRLGDVGERRSPVTYVLRMFGVRTVFLGLDLLQRDQRRRRHAVEHAPIIHASDVAAAALAGAARQLPLRAAVAAIGISSLNLVLALAARSVERRGPVPSS